MVFKNAEALQLVPCFLIYDSDVFNFVNAQIQTPEVFCKKSYSYYFYKFRNIYRKIPVLESLFNFSYFNLRIS